MAELNRIRGAIVTQPSRDRWAAARNAERSDGDVWPIPMAEFRFVGDDGMHIGPPPPPYPAELFTTPVETSFTEEDVERAVRALRATSLQRPPDHVVYEITERPHSRRRSTSGFWSRFCRRRSTHLYACCAYVRPHALILLLILITLTVTIVMAVRLVFGYP